MKLGIKVGLKGDSVADLEITKPDFCEVWFHSGKISEYDELFTHIKRLRVGCGLHFWGALADNTLANLCYPDQSVLKTSRDLIKKTIDAAAKNGCWYVNIHPGGARLSRVDFEGQNYIPYGPNTTFEQSRLLLAEMTHELAAYAQSRNIPLYIESVPTVGIGHPWYGIEGRLKPVEMLELPLKYYDLALKISNVYFTNDLGHTTANLAGKSRTEMKAFIFKTTTELVNQTKLLHVGYIIPPYNGTDYHGCLYYDEFKTNAAIPNYEEIKMLLSLFKNRPFVGALVEPEVDHPHNFQILKRLVAELV